MNKIATGLILGLGLTNATERYIIEYDNVAWNSLHLNSLPDNTVEILHNLQMTIADLSADEVSMYSEIPGIKVHKDAPVEMFKGGVQENPKDWGIDRIDQQNLPLDRKYRYGTDGEGTDVYIVDTGIKVTHNEFGGRATWDKNFAQDGVDDDCQGHGTHVASSVGGTTTGVAKKARLHAVKVLGCNGSGSNAGVIAGINYVVGTQLRNRQQKGVLNMSLGGGRSEVINAACQAAVKAGVVVVVAAGNENSDACNVSPASAPDAITIAASDINDRYASFSNWGKCVDLYAPGKDIYGAWIGSNSEYKTISGTSMASPHAAGVAALVLASGQAKTPKEVKDKMTGVASKNKINPVQRDTPNLLLYADPSWTTQSNESEHSKFSFRSLNNLN